MRMTIMWAAVAVAVSPALAFAQRGLFIDASPLLNVRVIPGTDVYTEIGQAPGGQSFVWNDLNRDGRFQPGEEGAPIAQSAPVVEFRKTAGRVAPGGSLAIGAFLTRALSVRAEASFVGSQIETTVPAPGSIRTLDAPERLTSRTSATDVFVAAAWHFRDTQRLSIAPLAGLAIRRQHDATTTTNEFLVLQTFNRLPTRASSPFIEESTTATTRYHAGVMAGVELAWHVTRRSDVVPHLRVTRVNSEWNLRPALAFRWRL